MKKREDNIQTRRLECIDNYTEYWTHAYQVLLQEVCLRRRLQAGGMFLQEGERSGGPKNLDTMRRRGTGYPHKGTSAADAALSVVDVWLQLQPPLHGGVGYHGQN